MSTFLGILLSITALLLIVVVLIQRGRGGGLAGALGGGGGQSAFGTKAGDLFTKITATLTLFWILLCIVTLRVLSSTSSKFTGASGSGQSSSATPGEGVTPPAGTDNSTTPDKSSGATTTGGAKPLGEAAPSGTTPAPASSKPAAPPAAK